MGWKKKILILAESQGICVQIDVGVNWFSGFQDYRMLTLTNVESFYLSIYRNFSGRLSTYKHNINNKNNMTSKSFNTGPWTPRHAIATVVMCLYKKMCANFYFLRFMFHAVFNIQLQTYIIHLCHCILFGALWTIFRKWFLKNSTRLIVGKTV